MAGEISVIAPQDLESTESFTDSDSFLIQRGNALLRVSRTLAGDFSGVVFVDNVESFFSNTATYAVNTYVRTRAEGFSYQAVASGGHVTNAGGQRFNIVDLAVTPQHYNANGTAARDVPAFTSLLANHLNIEIPYANYNFGDLTVTFVIRNGHRIVCHGANFTWTTAGTVFMADTQSNFTWTGATFVNGTLANAVNYTSKGRATSAGTTTTVVDTGFTVQAALPATTILMTSGNNSGETRTVQSIASDGTITVTAAFPNASAVGDKFLLLPNENFITIRNGARYRLEGIICNTIAGAAFRFDGQTGSGDRGDQGQISDCAAYESTLGFLCLAGPGTIGSGAEYNTFTNCNGSGCITGFDIGAGNQVFIGGNSVDNTDGFYIRDGFNNAHGIISGMQINHNNGFNVHARDVTNGQSFIGCHFYANGPSAPGQAAIFFEECTGIDINGGTLDGWVYNFTGTNSGFNYVRNMFCPGDSGNVRLLERGSPAVPSHTPPAELFVHGCWGDGALDGTNPINDLGIVASTGRRLKTDPVQTITAGAATVVQFPTVNTFEDRQNAFSGSTFTTPATQAGRYRIRVSLPFQGTGLTIAGSTVDIRTNTTGSVRRDQLIPGQEISGTQLHFAGEAEFYLEVGETVQVIATIAGTTVTFGSPAYDGVVEIVRVA